MFNNLKHSLKPALRLEMTESLRARWFMLYALVFGGIVALLFGFGLTESRILGFIGMLSRYIGVVKSASIEES